MPEASQSLTHSRWNGTYHVVFVPKRPRKALFGHIRPALGPIFYELARQKDCRIIAWPAAAHAWRGHTQNGPNIARGDQPGSTQ